MKKRMYVGLFMLLFYLIFAVTALPITAKADSGPKPSVRIQFKNMGDLTGKWKKVRVIKK